MKNKWKTNPLLRILMLLVILAAAGIVSGIGLLYCVFAIPEPEGLSLADWPNRFTDNFKLWMEDEDGTLQIKTIGLERLDEYGLWLQVLNEDGQEIFAYGKPENYPDHYRASELLRLGTSPYEDGYTVFVNSFETSGQTWNYLIGFPYAVGKYVLYYNGAAVSRLSPLLRMMIAGLSFAAAGLFLIYGFWLTRQTGKITKGIGKISMRTYHPLPEKGLFRGVYEALNQMDQEIRYSDQLKEATDRARREWITNITHDLKTPLSPIRGYGELLAGGTVTEALTVREYGSVIVKNADYAETLINDLKLTYQLESGSFPFHPEPVRLVRYLKELVIDIANDPAFSERTISFESEAGLAELTAAIDTGLFRRAVGNLVINALVHNPPETEVITAVAYDQEGSIRIDVCDNGTGISKEEQAGLFNRYYRGTNTKEKTEGSGLGLAIAKQIITLHGGSIDVFSKPGEGTVFSIRLPVNKDAAN